MGIVDGRCCRRPAQYALAHHYAFGAVDDWLFTHVAGVRAGAPGYRTIEFQPDLRAPFATLEASIETPYGYTGLRWRRTGTTTEVTVIVPGKLAKACRLTRAGVLHHVGSKEQILLDILAARDVADTLTEGQMTPQSAVDIRTALDAHVRRNISQPGIIKLYVVLSAEALDPGHPAHEFFVRRFRDNADMMSLLLGDFGRPGRTVAIEIYSFMEGLQANWLRDRSIDMWRQWTDFADHLFASRTSGT